MRGGGGGGGGAQGGEGEDYRKRTFENLYVLEC